MKYSAILIVVILPAQIAIAQPPDSLWSRSFGGESGEICWSLLPADDGGFLMAGYTESYGMGENDVWLLKTSASGDSLWSHAYGSEAEDVGYSMCPASDGGYLMAGYSSATGSQDYWLIKVDSEGVPEWDRRYGGPQDDRCWSIQPASDGGYVLVGWTNSFGEGGFDTWMLKVDSGGDSLWSRTFGGTDSDQCKSVIRTSDGGYVLTGYTGSSGQGGHDIWLIRTDANGDSLWTRTYGGPDQEEAQSVLETRDGGYLITGWGQTLTPGNTNLIAIRTDANGDSLWGRSYGGSESDFCNSAIAVMGGGYTLAGRTYSFINGITDLWLLRINENGDSLWSINYGGTDRENCLSFLQLADASYVLAGHTTTEESSYQFYLLKTTPDPLPADDAGSFLAQTFALSVYPNPFNPSATVSFHLPSAGPVRLEIFNLTGQRVATIIDSPLGAGSHSLEFNAAEFSSGAYLCRLTAGEYTATHKMLLIR